MTQGRNPILLVLSISTRMVAPMVLTVKSQIQVAARQRPWPFCLCGHSRRVSHGAQKNSEGSCGEEKACILALWCSILSSVAMYRVRLIPRPYAGDKSSSWYRYIVQPDSVGRSWELRPGCPADSAREETRKVDEPRKGNGVRSKEDEPWNGGECATCGRWQL